MNNSPKQVEIDEKQKNAKIDMKSAIANRKTHEAIYNEIRNTEFEIQIQSKL